MTFLTKTFLVTGKNRKMLLDRLKTKGVRVLKLKILDEKRAKFTIDSKDTLKFFAICKNSWYNVLVNIGGICAPFYICGKKAIIIVFAILFFALSFFCDNLYFGNVYQGDALYYRAVIEKSFEDAGIKKNEVFSQNKLDQVNKRLSAESSVAFISIQKRGNKAIIYLKRSVIEPKKMVTLNHDLVAEQDMVILNITVYSGTAVVSKGSFVKKGEVIASASYLLKEEIISCPLVCEVNAECTFEYIYEHNATLDDGVKANALAMAKFKLGDYDVRSFDFVELGKNKLKVTIKYEKSLIGG